MSFESNVGKPRAEAGPRQCNQSDCNCASCCCLKPAVGTWLRVPACGACAVNMEREGFSVEYYPETRFVIVHLDMGVYLGSCLGSCFWSKLNPVGQPAAATFPTRDAAEAAMKTLDCGRPLAAYTHPVMPDELLTGWVYASVAACVAAGLDAWDPGAIPQWVAV